MIDLILKDIQDPYIRENFFRLSRFLNEQIWFDGDFKFFDITLKSGVQKFKIKHGLTFIPADIVMLAMEGDYNCYFNYNDFDSEYIYVTVEGPVRLRFLAGRFKSPIKNRVSTEFFPFVAPPTAGIYGTTTWYTGFGIPDVSLGVPGDFYLDLTLGTKDVYLKTDLTTWTLQGDLFDDPTYWTEDTTLVSPSSSTVLISFPLASFDGGTFFVRIKDTGSARRRTLKMDVILDDGVLKDQVYAIAGSVFNMAISANINGALVEIVLTNNELSSLSAMVLKESN